MPDLVDHPLDRVRIFMLNGMVEFPQPEALDHPPLIAGISDRAFFQGYSQILKIEETFNILVD